MAHVPPLAGRRKWPAAVASALIAFAGCPGTTAETRSAPATSTSDVATSVHSSNYWPSFRGAGGLGHAVDANPPLSWSSKDRKNILWKTAIAMHGMSSPVVSGNRLFLTAADDTVRQVLCYDTNTGKLLWHHDVGGLPESPEPGLPHVLEETGFAAPTAVTDGRYVAAVFATGELVCLNVRGERVWAKHLGIPKNHYGHASSLTAYENLVIVQYDQKQDSKLLAYDFASGKPAWQVKRGAISWSSPILVDNSGRKEVVLTNTKGVDSYDPKTGTHLWHLECLRGEVASSAAYADGVVFVASEGATATAIDIRKHDVAPKILWQWDKALPDAASPVANKDFLILATGFGVVSCLDVKTGKVLWDHEFGEGFYSSPILVKDRVYLIDLSGRMQIFKMDKEFELLGVSELGEAAYATPALVGDRIYLRGVTHLFCIKQ